MAPLNDNTEVKSITAPFIAPPILKEINVILLSKSEIPHHIETASANKSNFL